MTRAALLALLSHWRKHPLHLLTLIAGLALATALWSGVQAINSEARASYGQAAGVLGQGGLDELRRSDGADIPLADYIALRRAGWQVTPVLEGRLTLQGKPWRILGVEPMTAPTNGPLASGFADDATRAFSPDGLLFANAETVAALKDAPLPPMAESQNLPPDTLLADIATAARLLKRPEHLSYLRVLKDQPIGLPPIAGVVAGLERRAPAGGTDLARLTDSFHLNLTAFGFLSFAVGLFIVHAFIGLTFEQRRPMFRTLRALGVPLTLLVGLILGELLGLALIAGVIGTVLGYLIAGALLPDVAASLSGLYGAEVTGNLTFRANWALAGIAMALAGVLMASAQALWAVWHLPVLASAHPRAWARASLRRSRVMGAMAVALLLCAGLLVLFGEGLAMGFAALASLLLGAALGLPLVLSALLGLAGGIAKGTMSTWFWADTRQQLPGLSLALMALLLALSANVGVSTMVSSFRLTFTGYLDQRLASELYLTAVDRDEGARLQAFLSDKVDAVLPIWSVEAGIAGRPAEIYGITPHATYRDNWPMLQAVPDVWQQVAAGQGALINEQLSYRAGLAPGDRITLAEGWSMPVVGVYSDYGNPEGQVIVEEGLLSAHFPGVPRLRFGVRITRDRLPGLKRDLLAFGLKPHAMVDQSAIKAASLGVFERTFKVTAALNVLTLSVAGFALLTSLMTLANMRLPQLAPVWAMGVTRARLARFELLRALCLAAFTMVWALPVGLALAWVLLNIVNVEAFGWRLPMFLFPADWAQLFGAAILAAGAAAFLPVRRLARLPAARLLQVFSHER